MAKENGLYRCEVCGNVVSVIEAHQGELVCCGQPMELLKEKTEEEGQEKHVPVVEKTEGGLKVKVGEVPHPMEEKHFIELIQAMIGGKVVLEKRLFPGEKPEMELLPRYDTENLKIRIYCNVHGLWTNK